MERFWKAAVGIGGVAAIGAFVFWSLYRDWLRLPLFSQISPQQTFQLMLIFLSLTFLSLVGMLIVYVWTKHLEAKRNGGSEIRSSVDLVSSSLERTNQGYEETLEGGNRHIRPKDSSPSK